MGITQTGLWPIRRPPPPTVPGWVASIRRSVAGKDRWKRMDKNQRLSTLRKRAFILSEYAWPPFDEVEAMLADTTPDVQPGDGHCLLSDEVMDRVHKRADKQQSKKRVKLVQQALKDLKYDKDNGVREERRLRLEKLRKAREKEEAERKKRRLEEEREQRRSVAQVRPTTFRSLNLGVEHIIHYRLLMDAQLELDTFDVCYWCFRQNPCGNCNRVPLIRIPEGDFCEIRAETELGRVGLVYVRVFRHEMAAKMVQGEFSMYPCPGWSVVSSGICYFNVFNQTVSLPAPPR